MYNLVCPITHSVLFLWLGIIPTGFVIDYHFKSSECFGKRFEDGLGMEDSENLLI